MFWSSLVCVFLGWSGLQLSGRVVMFCGLAWSGLCLTRSRSQRVTWFLMECYFFIFARSQMHLDVVHWFIPYVIMTQTLDDWLVGGLIKPFAFCLSSSRSLGSLIFWHCCWVMCRFVCFFILPIGVIFLRFLLHPTALLSYICICSCLNLYTCLVSGWTSYHGWSGCYSGCRFVMTFNPCNLLLLLYFIFIYYYPNCLALGTLLVALQLRVV